MEQAYIVGSQFSLADCALYPVLAYLKRRGCDFSGYSRLQRYINLLSLRPSIQKSLPEGWQHHPHRNLFAEARALLSG
jgi:glutathione S-transferase